MDRIHREDAALLKRFRQLFPSWCQFHILIREGQDGGLLAAPFIIRNRLAS